MADTAKACAAAVMPGCDAQLDVSGGYYAIAMSVDGRAHGVGAGFRTLAGATERALSTCDAVGQGACMVTMSGVDDGKSYLNCQ